MKRSLAIFLTFLTCLVSANAVDHACCHFAPPAGPNVICGWNLFLQADYILCSARQDGIGYARSGIKQGGNAPRGSLHHPDWKWSSGFQTALGINIPYNRWATKVRYTLLHTRNAKDKVKRNVNTGKTYYPTWDPGFLLQEDVLLLPLDLASTDWKLFFNVADIELGRNFFVSHFLALRPSVGVKGSWQDQKFRIRYINEDGSNYQIKIDQDFWGVGIRMGLDSSFYLTKRWSFFGNVFFSALWSQFKVNRNDLGKDPALTEYALIFSRRNDFRSIKPVFESYLGFRFDSWVRRNRFHIRLEAGWEEQLWFSQNQYLHVIEEAAHGDLNMHGLKIGGRISF